MTIEKKTIRSDIPGHHALMAGMAEGEARRLMVGRSIVLRGEIAACDHLVIEGAVEVSGLVTRRLDIHESGSFSGSAETRDAIIAGRFDGAMVVYGRLTIKAGARITGEIHYGSIEVEQGARMEAHIAALPAQEPQAPISAEQPVLAIVSTNDNTGTEDDTDSGEDETTKERTGIFRRAVGF